MAGMNSAVVSELNLSNKTPLNIAVDEAVLAACHRRAQQVGMGIEAFVQEALSSYLNQPISTTAAEIIPLESDNTSSNLSAPFCDDFKTGNAQAPMLRMLPAGTFQMGEAHGEEDQLPVHPVEIDHTFAMGIYPVTFDEYGLFVKATERQREVERRYTVQKAGLWAKLRGETEIQHRMELISGLPEDEAWGRGKHPVINVSWYDAVDYCRWLSEETGQQYRLPTEAEWAYAARAGTQGHYSFGSSEEELKEHAWFRDNSEARTHLVGKKKPNPWGLYDVHGNVWEWTCSLYKGHYDGSELNCPSSVQDSDYVALRGGSWHSLPYWARSASRMGRHPTFRHTPIGFRVVRIEN